MNMLGTALIGATIAVILSPDASAATVNHEEVVNAAGICEAAFSNQTVRNRPTGVRNTGTTSIYVTCSDDASVNGATTTDIWIRVANFGTGTASVGCNLQPGWTNGVTNTTGQGSIPKSVVILANGYAWLEFTAANYPATAGGFYNINFTCLLPPNTEIQYMGRAFDQEVGL